MNRRLATQCGLVMSYPRGSGHTQPKTLKYTSRAVGIIVMAFPRNSFLKTKLCGAVLLRSARGRAGTRPARLGQRATPPHSGTLPQGFAICLAPEFHNVGAVFCHTNGARPAADTAPAPAQNVLLLRALPGVAPPPADSARGGRRDRAFPPAPRARGRFAAGRRAPQPPWAGADRPRACPGRGARRSSP